MIRLYRPTLLLASAGMLLLLAACGQNFSGSGSSSSQPGFSGTPGTAQVVKTGVPTRTPLHPSPTPTPPAQLTGKVTVQLARVPQQVSDSMVFTINNQTNQRILFSDHLTGCTVLLLQVQSPGSGTWQAVALCKLMTPTRLLALEAGKTLSVTLTPPGSQWTPGLYRALLSYVPTGADRTARTVFSPSFQVGS